MLYICAKCGRSFFRRNHGINHRAKYCSKNCQFHDRPPMTEELKEKLISINIGNKYSVGLNRKNGGLLKCKTCGTEYYASETHSKTRKYCSRECKPAWNKGKENLLFRGELNPKWKGGITKINEKLRKSIEYKEWRRFILKRDNYTCQLCGKRGGLIQVDHIKPWSIFEELRFDIDNGRVLCVPCHNNTPTWGFRLRNYATKNI